MPYSEFFLAVDIPTLRAMHEIPTDSESVKFIAGLSDDYKNIVSDVIKSLALSKLSYKLGVEGGKFLKSRAKIVKDFVDGDQAVFDSIVGDDVFKKIIMIFNECFEERNALRETVNAADGRDCHGNQDVDSRVAATDQSNNSTVEFLLNDISKNVTYIKQSLLSCDDTQTTRQKM